MKFISFARVSSLAMVMMMFHDTIALGAGLPTVPLEQITPLKAQQIPSLAPGLTLTLSWADLLPFVHQYPYRAGHADGFWMLYIFNAGSAEAVPSTAILHVDPCNSSCEQAVDGFLHSQEVCQRDPPFYIPPGRANAAVVIPRTGCSFTIQTPFLAAGGSWSSGAVSFGPGVPFRTVTLTVDVNRQVREFDRSNDVATYGSGD